MKANWLRFVILSVGLWFNALAMAEGPKNPQEFFFNETWGNMQEELANAKEQGKSGIMIFFEMDECPFCHYMKTNVLNQPQIQAYYRENFLIFSIDIEGDIEMVNFKGETTKQKDFAFKENRVRATPVLAFFDLNGKRVHRHIGKTNGTAEFLLMGQYVVEGAYKNSSFVKYKRNKRKKS